MTTREQAIARDAADPLAPLRELFELPPGMIYLDGNSLGPLPRATPARLAQAITAEWGQGLIGSWNSAGWMELPRRIGDAIAPLIGSAIGQVVVADSTSVNLHKVLAAALRLAPPAQRRVILTEQENFPTDRYIAAETARMHGASLESCSAEGLDTALTSRPAVLLLTQVNYRTGAMHDMAAVTQAAHRVGTLVVWDLAHSAGAVPVDLLGASADFAVGCGYKFLNGGPGAPAFLWVHPRHADRAENPLPGWLGHAEPFDFTADYAPAPGVARFICGSPAVLSMTALECGVATLRAADAFGGMAAIRAKSLALTALFMERAAARCPGLRCVTPAARGSQVSFAREEGGYAIIRALITRGVIGDFRAADILRFGVTPLYTRFIDVWDAVEHLAEVLENGEWRQPRFAERLAVT
ncbi:MAG: kynureninase [Alphaproteobacteria bacterium]|nr:kynureninase [Alphaproteobacteria bacterium]